ncbi:phytanoyl-CoA dioxygenase family protein, partial [bacterium]|nr:phytanoyl-CoA dioxygenase family protein [bacterium]
TAAEQTNTALSTEEMDQFRTQGFLGPFALCSPKEMGATRPAIEAVLESEPPDHRQKVHNRHLDHRLIWDLATDPEIISRMQCLYGDDLLMWRTNFFVKEPGAKEIPWHQDHNYWPLEPPVIASAWIAIDESTVENSCLQVIPGSHRRTLPHVRATEDMGFAEMGDLDYLDLSQAVDLEMRPGEFILFNERTVHHSESNRSQKRRIGLAVRVVVPIVSVLKYDAPEHALVQISGRDPMGFNKVVDPLTE